jgi:hypothetical protein
MGPNAIFGFLAKLVASFALIEDFLSGTKVLRPRFIRRGSNKRTSKYRSPKHPMVHVSVPPETGKDQIISNAPPSSFHPQAYRQIGDQV